MKHIAVLIIIAGFATLASAQVHRCKDAATGKTVYSDVPCPSGQAGELIERQKSAQERQAEREQADAALQRKYRQQAEERTQADSERESAPVAAGASPAALAGTPACKQAQKELDFVSSIRTLSADEKRLRMNATIARANAACGSSTPLLPEPVKVVVPPSITHCDPGFCYDERGGLYRRNGPDSLTGPQGQTCSRVGAAWTCG